MNLEYENYFNKNKKLFRYLFSSVPYFPYTLSQTQNNLNYLDKLLVYNLNISHLNENDDWNIESSKYFDLYKKTEFMTNIRDVYLHKSQRLLDYDGSGNLMTNNIYPIISETIKIELNNFSDLSNDKFISTIELNWNGLYGSNGLYDGITNIYICLFDSNVDIETIKIRSKIYTNNENFRNLEWMLEFEKINSVYKILGIDNFLHMSLIGLKEVFIDIIYAKNNTNSKPIINEKQIDDCKFGYMKLDVCHYCQTIKFDIEIDLCINDESNIINIIDYLIDCHESSFNNMNGLVYSN